MKTKFSIVLFFAFLYCTSQEITNKEAFKKCRKEFSKKICLSEEDEDSVLFYLDKCPKAFGFIDNDGCPWPDTDGDVVVDKDDYCPEVAGPPENNGCPWPDTDGDGILDKDDRCPTVPGRPELDGCSGRNGRNCTNTYENEKGNYEKGLIRINEIDFDKLFDKILQEKEFKEYFIGSKKIVFLNLNRIKYFPECGNDGYYDCPHFEKDLYEEISKKLWNKTNFNKLQKKIGNRIIIPVSLSRDWEFIFGEQNEDNNFFVNNKIPNFYRGKLIGDGEIKEFYYYSNQKPQKELIIKNENRKISNIDYVIFTIAVVEEGRFKDFANKNLEIEYRYITQLKYNDEKSNDKSSIAKLYKYENGDWIFLEEYK